MKTMFLVGIGFTFLCLIGLFVVPNALASFHVFGAGGKAANDASGADAVNPDNVEQMADQYYSAYTSVIDDMLTFQKNPDYNRAEAQRQAAVNEAQALIPRFKALASNFKSRYDQLSAQEAAQTATPQPTAQPTQQTTGQPSAAPN